VGAAKVIAGAQAWSAAGAGDRARVGVVICHGFTGNPLATRPLGERFATEGYTVEVPRLPGHGTTHQDLGRTRYEDWYGTLEATAADLRARCEQVVAIGHSMGGTLTLDLATRRPDLVDVAAVINPQVSDPIQPLAKLAPVLKHLVPFIQRDLAGLPSNDIARPDVEEGAYRHVSAKAAHSLTSQLRRLRGQLPDLEQPLLLAWSPDDHTVPADNAAELKQLVGTADVTEVVCDRSYHVPQLDYDRPKLEAALLDFVARTTGS